MNNIYNVAGKGKAAGTAKLIGVSALILVFGVVPLALAQEKTPEQLKAEKEEKIANHLKRAEELRGGGRYEEAILEYQSALLIEDRPEIRMGMGDTYLQKEPPDVYRAIATYHEILKKFPDFARARGALEAISKEYHVRALKLSSAGSLTESIEPFKVAIAAKPDAVEIRRQLKDVFRKLIRYDEAVEQLRGMLRGMEEHRDLYTKGDIFQTRKELALLLSWRRRFDEAIAEYNTMLQERPNDVETMNGLARVISWKGNYEEALDIYRQILELDPKYNKARLGISSIYGWQQKYDASISIAEEVFENDPNKEDRRYAYYQLGRVYSWKGDYEKAIETYKEVLSREPDDVYANVGIGRVYNWQGDYDRAVQYYLRALKVDPRTVEAEPLVEANLGLADIYMKKLEVEKAKRYYRAALAIDPGNENARNGLANAFAVRRNTATLASTIEVTDFGGGATSTKVSPKVGLLYAFDNTFSMFIFLTPAFYADNPSNMYTAINVGGTYQAPSLTAYTYSLTQAITPAFGPIQTYNLELVQSFYVAAWENTPLGFVNKTVPGLGYTLNIQPFKGDIRYLSYIHTLAPNITYYFIPELNLQVKGFLSFTLNDPTKHFVKLDEGGKAVYKEKDYFDATSQSLSASLTFDTLTFFSITASASYTPYSYSEEVLEAKYVSHLPERDRIQRIDSSSYGFSGSTSLILFDVYELTAGYGWTHKDNHRNEDYSKVTGSANTQELSIGLSYSF
ncbi:MAG: tetratricopeptide repeat protein [bacterium]